MPLSADALEALRRRSPVHPASFPCLVLDLYADCRCRCLCWGLLQGGYYFPDFVQPQDGDLVLQIITHPRRGALLRKALRSVLEEFQGDMQRARAEASARAEAAQSAHNRRKQLEDSCHPDRQVAVHVFGLAGQLGDVHCDCGSTIFYVKELIEEKFGAPVDQQVLIFDTHKLLNEDILRWFQVDDLRSVKLTLVKSETQARSRSCVECAERRARRSDHAEFESAYKADAEAKKRLKEARDREAVVPRQCSWELQEVAELASLSGLSAWFQNALARWDKQAGTTFAKDCEEAMAKEDFSFDRLGPYGVLRFLKPLLSQDQQEVTQRMRTQTQELRFKQRAAWCQLRAKELRLARPRQRRAQAFPQAQLNH